MYLWQNITKTTGARAPVSKKPAYMTLTGVIPGGHFEVYVSFKVCGVGCHGVTGCYSLLLYYFFLSFMTEKKEKYNNRDRDKGLSGI
jgi:hypothetical protein